MTPIKADFESLGRKISGITEFPIALDRHFKFLVLLTQEANPNLEATRRYYGKLMNGELYYRGIELRRHDFPNFLKYFERRLMEIRRLGSANLGNAIQEDVRPCC